MSDVYRGFSIKVNPADLQNAAAELSKKINSMKRVFSEMSSKVSSTANYWQGSASDKYRSEFREAQPDFEEAFARLSEHVSDLYSIAGIYTGVEKDITGLSNELSDDVIV